MSFENTTWEVVLCSPLQVPPQWPPTVPRARTPSCSPESGLLKGKNSITFHWTPKEVASTLHSISCSLTEVNTQMAQVKTPHRLLSVGFKLGKLFWTSGPKSNLSLLESFLCFSFFWKSSHFLSRGSQTWLSFPWIPQKLLMASAKSLSTLIQRSSNHGQNQPPPSFVKKVLLKHSHAPSLAYSLRLLSL